jgi:diketogulonate reductase-like aldo/keto reductase
MGHSLQRGRSEAKRSCDLRRLRNLRERPWATVLVDHYRHVDTAPSYRNEEGVGRVVRASGLAREEVFVTTKMTPGAGDPERELAGSLARLGLDWVDLYLIHWPTGASDAVWSQFERLHAQGLARAIGVSNYDPGRLGRLVAQAAVPPMVNQVDFSPFAFSPVVVEAHRRAGVVLEAYSPLARGRRIDHPVIAEVARRHGRTPAQVMVRWAVQRAIPAIPKSGRRERIIENRRVFDFALTDADMAHLDALGDPRGRVS